MVSLEFACAKIELKTEQLLAAAFLLFALAAPSLAKPFVDTFAYGTSYARVYGVAAYAFALAFYAPALSFLSQLADPRGQPGRNAKKGRLGGSQEGSRMAGFVRFLKPILSYLRQGIDSRLLIAMLALVFAYGLLGQYFFVSAVGGDLNTKYFAFDARGFTSSHLNHIHALKTIFCPFDPSDDVDCARPMLPYLPSYYPAIGLALFLLAWALAIACYPKMQGASEKVAYFILTFASIKTSVDGGALNFENLAFFMLVPFLLARQKRLAWTLAGVALWVPLIYSTYEFYEPTQLALPMLTFFYPVSIVAMKPKLLFPLLIIALVSPTYVLTYSEVVKDRWQPEACSNSGLNPNYQLVAGAKVYTPCQAKQEFGCGIVEARNHTAIYAGKSVKKPELMLSKGLSSNCSGGVFSISWIQGSIRVLNETGG